MPGAMQMPGMPGMAPAGYPMMQLPGMPYGYPYMAPGLGAYAAYGALPTAAPLLGSATGASNAENSDGREECGDFKRGKCDRGDSCRYIHVKPSQECRDFKAGRCTRGANCKFLHAGDIPQAADRQRSRSRSPRGVS